MHGAMIIHRPFPCHSTQPHTTQLRVSDTRRLKPLHRTRNHIVEAVILCGVNKNISTPYCDLVVFADPSLYLTGPSSQTPHVPHGHPYPVNMNWQKSEPPATSSHGPPPFTGHAPQVTRAATMPVPVFYSPTGTTTTTSQNPYRSQYPPPAQYDASMRHGGQPSYSIPMPTPQPSNYPRAHGMSALRVPSANLLLT